jgi:co-chaperonin GroES (HSP10)
MTFTPSWKKYEKDIHNPDDAKAIKATDAFIEERAHEIKTDPQAKRWEEGRKKEIAKNKPLWKKEQIHKEEEPLRKIDREFKQMGRFEYGLKPAPGYILVEPKVQEEQTANGIYLPEVTDSPNTGTVLEAGSKLFCKHCFVSLESQPTESPVKKGDKILFKKGAGVEIEAKGVKCKLMMFSDVLGTLE